MRTRDVVFSVGVTACTAYEVFHATNAARALEASAMDAAYLAILFYGMIWVSRQIYGECKVNERQALKIPASEPVVSRGSSTI